MRFLHLIKPVMCIVPEVAEPDRKVRRDPNPIPHYTIPHGQSS